MISIPSDVNGHPNVVSLRDPSYHESRNQAHWVVDASSMETNPSVESNVSLPATSSRTTQKRLRRAKLSCLECRRKKLSCDRSLPCQRCIRSRRAAQCSFEDGPHLPLTEPEGGELQNCKLSKQVLQLRSEFSQLKGAIANIEAQLNHDRDITDPKDNASTTILSPGDGIAAQTPSATFIPEQGAEPETFPNERAGTNYAKADPSLRSPYMFYSRQYMFRFFHEIPALWPLLRETAEDWIRPLNIHLEKDKSNEGTNTTRINHVKTAAIEELLPTKTDVDNLVSFYLDHLEHVYRVVHMPSFRQDYNNYWEADTPREISITMLIIAICSLSASTHFEPGHPQSLTVRYRHMRKRWLTCCDAWLAQASRKHRKTVHHQVACIVYLSKRVHLIDKKSWWKLTASMVQDAILDGLQYETASCDRQLTKETRKRPWATIRELDLQNSFEFGLPTLLHSVDSDILPPANMDDTIFDADTGEVLLSAPPEVYTRASYQYHTARSWNLRLEICERLNSCRSSKPLSYEDVLRYTSLIMQAVEDILSWSESSDTEHDSNKALVSTLLLGMMQLPLLALHRSYLRVANDNGQSSLSQTISHTISNDVLISYQNLKESSLASVTLLRSDVLLASLNVTRISMMQYGIESEFKSRSKNVAARNSSSTIEILESCLPLMDQCLPRRSPGGHWDLMVMGASITLLKLQLGLESRESAKATIAQRFLDTYSQYFGTVNRSERGRLRASYGGSDTTAVTPELGIANATGLDLVTASAIGLDDKLAEQLDFPPFDLDLDVGDLWDDWASL